MLLNGIGIQNSLSWLWTFGPLNGSEPVPNHGRTEKLQTQEKSITSANVHIPTTHGYCGKKVCRKLAGSALLKDEKLVAAILSAVVAAVGVPVTLKIRTGWDLGNRNAEAIARIAEDAGIQSLAVHGRTRACAYKGEAEFETIARVKQAVAIPVIANGDITSIEKSLEVLRVTNCDGLMIGRGAQGRPWIFRELQQFMQTGSGNTQLEKNELRDTMLDHLSELHRFYGDLTGVRVARKHLIWYCQSLANADDFRHRLVRAESAAEQIERVTSYFEQEYGSPRARESGFEQRATKQQHK